MQTPFMLKKTFIRITLVAILGLFALVAGISASEHRSTQECEVAETPDNKPELQKEFIIIETFASKIFQ